MSLFAHFLCNSVKPICCKVKQHLGFGMAQLSKWHMRGLILGLWSIKPTQTHKWPLEGPYIYWNLYFAKRNKMKWKRKQNKVVKVFFFFRSSCRSYYWYRNNVIRVNMINDLEPLKICFVLFSFRFAKYSEPTSAIPSRPVWCSHFSEF